MSIDSGEQSVSDLEKLKSLLFGAEKKTLESLSERLAKTETRASDVAEVLPDAIRLSHNGNRKFIDELREPVAACVKQSLVETPQEYVDVLYPVMGPAIRKSIAQALKAFAQQINQTMEYSLSVKGLSWRLKAFRSGVPFSDYVMQQTLQYRVEQAYLISRENGLLVSHVHHEAAQIKDGDAVSAMFTAIQDFVQDSFSPDPSSRLETADMGEFTLWALHGPHAIVVCVIRGVPPRTLRNELNLILERIHFRYNEALRNYSGDSSTVAGVEKELQQALELQAQHDKTTKLSRVWIVIGLAVVVSLFYLFTYGQERVQDYQELKRIELVLADTPGIYLGSVERVDGQFLLHGLRDPLALGIDQIAEQAKVDAALIRFDFRPYQSLEPAIVSMRLKKILNPPTTVSINLVEGELEISGLATQAWVNKLMNLVNNNYFVIPIITKELHTAKVLLNSENDVGEKSLILLEITELNQTEFYFSEELTLLRKDFERLELFSERLKTTIDSALNHGVELSLAIVGLTDETGERSYNQILSKKRASLIASYLSQAGINAELIQVRDPSLAELNSDRRSAIVELIRKTSAYEHNNGDH